VGARSASRLCNVRRFAHIGQSSDVHVPSGVEAPAVVRRGNLGILTNARRELVMEIGFLMGIVAVIRAEEQRRGSQRTHEDPIYEYDHWLFTDAPFVNELCLMVLVTLWHQVERELVGLAARAASDGKEISPERYHDEVQGLRKGKLWDWIKINARLKLQSCQGQRSMEALRHLANSYKHHPSMEPNEELVKLLNLETGVNYAPLPESDSVQAGLKALVGLGNDSSYCDIAERFIHIASDFLVDLQRRVNVSPVKWKPVSLKLSDFAR